MNNNDTLNDEQIRKALSDLGVQMHIPAEIILEYVRGSLSSDICQRINSHLEECADCRKVQELAEQSATWEKEAEAQAATSDLPIRLPSNIEPKLQLVAKVNNKRKDIAEHIARLLLPEDSWGSINLVISAMEKWQEKETVESPGTRDDILAAAFSSAAVPGGRREFELIGNAVDFTNLACELVCEKTHDIDELEQTLPECVTEAIFVLKDVEPDEHLRQKLMAVFMQNLSKDDTK